MQSQDASAKLTGTALAPPQTPSDAQVTSDQSAAATAAAALLVQQRLLQSESEPTIEMPDLDGRQRIRNAQAADVQRETAPYGIAPKRYRSELAVPTNPTERRFAAALPVVTALVNARLAAAGVKFKITEAEVATNFLSEGGILLMQQNTGDGISGFQAAGIDTLVDRYAQVKHLLPPDLVSMIDNKQNLETNTNERGQEVHSLTNLSVEQAMYANAALFANARGFLIRDLASQGRTWESLTPREQFYWSTVYYNAGEGTGRAQLTKYGVAFADKPLTAAEASSANSSSPHYNAAWRTATWQLVSGGSTAVASGITPLPMRKMSVSAVQAELAQVYEAIAVPVLRGQAPLKTLQRAVDENTFATSGLQGAKVAMTDDMTRFSGTINSLAPLSQTVDTFSSSQYKSDLAACYAAAGRPVPSWPDLTLTQIISELKTVGASNGAGATPLDASRQVAFQLGTMLEQQLEGAKIFSLTPDERNAALAPLRAELLPVAQGKAPIGDGFVEAMTRFQALAIPGARLGADDQSLSDASSSLCSIAGSVSDLAQQLGDQLPQALAAANLPNGPLTGLTLKQVSALVHTLASKDGPAQQTAYSLAALFDQGIPTLT